MATPPLAPDHSGKRQARIDRLKGEALATANQFKGSTVGYDLSHDMPFIKGSNELAMLRFSPATPGPTSAGAQEWLKEFTPVDEALGRDATSFSSLNIDNNDNLTLFITSRAEEGRDAPFATEPARRARRPRSKEETPEQNRQYARLLFDQLVEWLDKGPTRNLCVRTWEPDKTIEGHDGRHLFSITVPASERAALDAIEQELRTPQTGRLPEQTPLLEDKRYTSHVEKIRQQAHQPENRFGRDRILYDLAQITETDAAGHIYTHHVHAQNRGTASVRFIYEKWNKEAECHTQTHHGESTHGASGQLIPLSPDADTLTVRLNPDSHSRDYTPRRIPRLTIQDTDLRRETMVDTFIEPLKQWLKDQGVQHFELGLREIPSSHRDMPNSFILRVSVSAHDANAKEQLVKVKDTIEDFKLKTYTANSKGGMIL